MNDEDDASREYERLRAELAEFVLEALTERMARGERPELSAALAEAIERRVDGAVDARIARLPDPETFADDVIAAARGRAGAGEERGPSRGGSGRSRGSPRPSGFALIPFLLGFVAALGVTLAAYFVNGALQPAAPVQTNVQTPPLENGVVPTSEGNVSVLVDDFNQAAPAGANQQGPGR